MQVEIKHAPFRMKRKVKKPWDLPVYSAKNGTIGPIEYTITP